MERETGNYELITDMAQKLQNLKGYEVGYGNPRKGKMIINYNGQNFLVEVEPIEINGESTLENAMKEYAYMFK